MAEAQMIGLLIGRHKYTHLKALVNLTNEQQAQLKAYENKYNSSVVTAEQNERSKAYFRKLNMPVELLKFNPTTKKLIIRFWFLFEQIERKSFVNNDETKSNLMPLIYYFLKDDQFFKCANLKKNFMFRGQSKESEPSFDKGLLIIGNYGNGKSSMLQIFQRIMLPYENMKFGKFTANQVVRLYEACQDAQGKQAFWSNMNRDIKYFDDVKTEGLASNYGKSNLFKDVIEERYDRKSKTYITCNYKEGKPGDMEAALLEFGEKYGSRVFDRLFEMFNIIEFKGKSFRK